MPDVGFCIYCDSTNPPLSREHIIASGLGGNRAPEGEHEALVLHRASCDQCRDITRKIEEDCLIDMLGPARRRLGLTRKDRRSPTSLGNVINSGIPFEELTLDDMVYQQLSDEHLLGAMNLPGYRMAQFYPDATEEDSVVTDNLIVVADPESYPEKVDALGVRMDMDAKQFARMLAKIGLGFSVAKIGWESFTPFVRGLITGSDDNFHQWVGGMDNQPGFPRSPADDSLHRLGIVTDGGIVTVMIQLFSRYRGPLNYVIVGAINKEFENSRRVRSMNGHLTRIM